MDKKCSECCQWLSREAFYKADKAKDGLQSICKLCCAEAGRVRYEKNKERRKNQTRDWKEANHEKVLAHKKAYRERKKLRDK